MRNLKVWAGVVVGVVLMSGSALAYDPPRIIGTLHGEPPGRFAEEFCWVGDQNGDGYDDLMLNHDPDRRPGHPNVIKLFYGGAQFDTIPDFIFRPNGLEDMGEYFDYAGNLGGGSNSWIIINTAQYPDTVTNSATSVRTLFFKAGDQLDSIPDFVMSSVPGQGGLFFGESPKKRPADYNGDGYDDWLTFNSSLGPPYVIQIYNGGEAFDTIPDWSSTFSEAMFRLRYGEEFCTGCDINGDGYPDFMFYQTDPNGVHWVDLFLGGNPMDTIPAFRLDLSTFAPREISEYSLVVLPDINGDGYDDWGLKWWEGRMGWDESGFYIFYGGEHPDTEPDLDLDDNHSDSVDGTICGGDFNNDGFGDIISIWPVPFDGEGELKVYFGSRRMSDQASITINMTDTYHHRISSNMGALGDYNGDGRLDLVSRNQGFVEILTGGQDWVSVRGEKPKVPITHSVMKVFPNPFNQTLNVSIESSVLGKFDISVFAVSGRLMCKNVMAVKAGEHAIRGLPTDDFPAGVYLIHCTELHSGFQQIQKAVLLR